MAANMRDDTREHGASGNCMLCIREGEGKAPPSPSRSDMADKTLRAAEFLTGLCGSRMEMLTILMHLVAAGLQEEVNARRLKRPDDEKFVTAYLVKITHMLDGVFDRR